MLDVATKNSGRLIDQAEIIESGNMVAGPDGEGSLHSHQPVVMDAVHTSSLQLTAAGYNQRSSSKTLTYDEYYKMLKDMKAASANQNSLSLVQVSWLVVTLVLQKLHILTIFRILSEC
ncbi:MAG: hypothetical protein ACLS9K_01455 [Lachnospira eligens]